MSFWLKKSFGSDVPRTRQWRCNTSSVCGFSHTYLDGCVIGHSEAVLSVQFSPDSRMLASGSGDTTVRFWDIYTQTPLFTCTGKVWILVLNLCYLFLR